MDHIGCVYYINLDHRTDRRQQIEEALDALRVPSDKRVRIPGLYTEGFGILGCGLSHKLALETFLTSGHSTCLILEDDFTVTLDTNYCSYLLRSVFEKKVPFDVVMLAGKIFKEERTEWPFLRKVLDGQTASAFLITKEFAPKLIECLTDSTRLLKDWHDKTGERKHEYCNDIYWKKLQPEARWYITAPKLGLQRESYSDNEKRVTNYGV